MAIKMATQRVLVAGEWRRSNDEGTFQATDPASMEPIPDAYPISSWSECQDALEAAQQAFQQLRRVPRDAIADFLTEYAAGIEARTDELCQIAEQETALPIEPRLKSIELPRTTNQLRLAAESARTADWTRPIVDTENNIRSCLAPLGPVAIFGPNNFPFAFNAVSGGDFAAAIAAGNPVIAKSNPMHPGTTRLLAEAALDAVQAAELPSATVQLLYQLDYHVGEQLVSDPRLAAIGYTGSRAAGLKLKQVADAVGKPIYLELSSINPVVILPGALEERCEQIAEELSGSCLMGSGQFCTSPGLLLTLQGDLVEQLIAEIKNRFESAPVGTLFSLGGQQGLSAAVTQWTGAGAEIVCGGKEGGGRGYSFANTLLRVTAERFFSNPQALQSEAFGNAALVVTAASITELESVLELLEGNLTGCIYSSAQGSDDQHYQRLVPILKQKVGRLLNDKVPTGVAVSPAMNHGGPFPATGHPGFTAVGIPSSITRFTMLQCFDQVRIERLPDVLQDENPRKTWRCIDGEWTQAGIPELAAAHR